MNNPCRSKFRFFIPLIVLAFVAVGTWVVMALWNGVLADVLGVKLVTYWQALGILVLAKILFGGFPGRRRDSRWKKHIAMERWKAMTPEMREEMRRKFGDWPKPGCDCGPEETPGTPAS